MSEDTDIIKKCKDDGMAWAEEFCKTAEKLGYGKLDQDWVFGWFANAIETSYSYRMSKKKDEHE